ncbi:MAG: exodeoxyribonuclease VII small subunit [Bacteroidaceae bacterium]|nr:exodeoxyribonuclease VII small subunit [Bacteroidaceae bacterium]
MKKDEMTYENAMKRLEEIVDKVENGQMDIDSLSATLKEAQELVAFCRDKLTKVDAEIKKILEN